MHTKRNKALLFLGLLVFILLFLWGHLFPRLMAPGDVHEPVSVTGSFKI